MKNQTKKIGDWVWLDCSGIAYKILSQPKIFKPERLATKEEIKIAKELDLGLSIQL